MNYNDQILENKPFNFFKQLMYNIALSICIMLVGVLILVYGFKFRLYEVLSDSQAPEFVKGDMVIVKAQKEYEVGDIIKFDTTIPVTHRLIAIMEENNTTYYICHGDNVQSANPANGADTAPWREDSEYVQSLIDNGLSLSDVQKTAQNIQVAKESQIEGKVIGHIGNYGTYFQFIKSHYMLLIALVAGIWCINSTVQNEIDMRRCGRLM
ncbi:MAG: hypothetical protein IJ415_03260 [Clostridia bacterium]|nr:hypothetical protein [Clostridia bacterium]